jgi:Ca2+-transporting ATPase
MDGPPAQSLGVEPVDPAVMTRPPRRKQAPVLTRALLRRVLICAACITAGTLSTYVHALSADASYATSSSPFDGAATAAAAVVAGPRRGGVHAEGPAAGPLLGARSLPAGPQPAPAPGGAPSARATTLTFTAFVLFDMFNALTCRSATKSVLRGQVRLLSGNRMFNAAVAASLAAQAAVVHVPALQRVFQTEALGWGDWAGLAALASLVLWVDEACKWWNGRKAGGARGYSDNV